MSKEFEVQTYTLCEGWKNLWTVDGQTETFNSHEEAEHSIKEHLKECLKDGIKEDKYNYRIIKKDSEDDDYDKFLRGQHINRQSLEYKQGKQASKQGKKYTDNPHSDLQKKLNWSSGHNTYSYLRR